MTDDFQNVVDDLARGRNLPTILDDGTRVWVWHDALLAQLREAVASSLTGGNGTSKSATALPFDPGALELQDSIEHAIGEFMRAEYDQTGDPKWIPRLTPEENLLALNAHAWQNDGPDLVRQWRASILHILDRKGRGEFTVHMACPVCKQTHWVDEAGDIGADPIVVTYLKDDPIGTVIAGCRATGPGGTLCGTIWDSYEAIKELGEELGIEPAAVDDREEDR